MVFLLEGLIRMTAAATAAALIIMVFRALLSKKLPRSFFYALWAIVFARMLVPFSLPPLIKLPGIPWSGTGNLEGGALSAAGTVMGQGAGAANSDLVQNGGEALMPSAQSTLSEAAAKGNELFSSDSHILTAVIILWLAGAVFMLAWGAVSYIRTARTISTAVLFEDQSVLSACKTAVGLGREARVYWCEAATSPFVFGFFRPKIILPVSFRGAAGQGDGLRHVLLHELSHVKRFDMLIKPAAFVALCLHWWNPVLWIAFKLLEKDMEMSCDEKSVGALGIGRSREYAATLLEMAVEGQGFFRGAAVTFNESSVGERVKNIMTYKKKGIWIGALCVLLFVGFGWALLSNPLTAQEKQEAPENILIMCSAEGSLEPDTFLLARFHQEAEKTSLEAVFIPRDMVLENGEKVRYYASKNYGVDVAKSVGKLLGTEIPNYIKMDTAVVGDMVDAMGGVEIDVPMNMVYDDPYATPPLHINLRKGMQVLDGEEAVMYLSYRKGYEMGDLGRIEAQKRFLTAVLNQAYSQKDYQNLFAVCKDAYGKTDTNMSRTDILALAHTIQKADLKPENVEFTDLPYTMTMTEEPPYSVILNKEKPLAPGKEKPSAPKQENPSAPDPEKSPAPEPEKLPAPDPEKIPPSWLITD